MLDTFFNPASIALIGASDDRTKIGGKIVAFSLGAKGERIMPSGVYDGFVNRTQSLNKHIATLQESMEKNQNG